MADHLLDVRNVTKSFPARRRAFLGPVGDVRAVDDVSLVIPAGTAYGLVGESGSGKTTLGRVILRLIEPTWGQIYFEGRDLATLRGAERQADRHRIQMVFPASASSLDPRQTVRSIVGEPVLASSQAGGARSARVRDLIARVGLGAADLDRRPGELSAGQRQRIGIARALALNPKLLVLDAPTDALDLSEQAQILNLLLELQRQFGLTFLFMSQDLAVIRYVCDQVGVMYRGRIVEEARADDLLADPQHPYTRSLLAAIPDPNPDHPFQPMANESPVGGLDLPHHGCRFAPRCPFVMGRCWAEDPLLQPSAPAHAVACHLYESANV
jgi:oligopeptide transport system ATP-binding protein